MAYCSPVSGELKQKAVIELSKRLKNCWEYNKKLCWDDYTKELKEVWAFIMVHSVLHDWPCGHRVVNRLARQ